MFKRTIITAIFLTAIFYFFQSCSDITPNPDKNSVVHEKGRLCASCFLIIHLYDCNSGEALANQEITVNDPNGNPIFDGTTDNNGTVSFYWGNLSLSSGLWKATCVCTNNYYGTTTFRWDGHSHLEIEFCASTPCP